MSEVKEVKVNNTEGLTLKAGNTVETLTPKQVAHVDTPKVDAPKAQETPKAASPKDNPPKEAKNESITDTKQWQNSPVSQIEFAEYQANVIAPLIKALEDLSARIDKHNVGAPHKI